MASGTNGLVSITYRGEENLWGNIWKWIDEINVYNYNVGNLFVSNYNFTDNSNTSPYEDAGFTFAGTNGYISAFGYNTSFDWLFYPSETLGSSTNPIGDYFAQTKSASNYTVPKLGGAWYFGTLAGTFCNYSDDVSTARGKAIGARLVYIP